MEDANLSRFGHIVRQRRVSLGLTQDAVTRAGGPSDRRQSMIERGQEPAPHLPTLAKVDKALRWKAGSSAAILRGGDPTPLDDRTYTAEDVERRVALEVALTRAGVQRVAAREHTADTGDDYRLSPEVIDQLIAVLNSLPPSPA